MISEKDFLSRKEALRRPREYEPLTDQRREGRRTLGMFNDTWIALTLFIIVLGLVAHQEGLLVIAALLLTVLPVAWLWNRYALSGVQYERTLSEKRAFIGETVELTVRIANRKLLPLSWLQVEDDFPTAIPLEKDELEPSSQPERGYLCNLLAMRWYERVSRRYLLRCEQRGYFQLGPAHLQSGDIFGLFSTKATAPHLDWLIIYPRVLPIEGLELPPKDPFGEVKAQQRMFEDPSRTIGVRDYQPQDSFRHIHWKATARRQALQSKVYEPSASHNLVIFLNVAMFAKHWEGTRPALLERTISTAASIASYGIEHRYTVGLVANGSLPRSDQPIKVLPSRNPRQLTRILEMLAAVHPLAPVSFERLLTAESPKLPWGATLVIVTAVTTETLMITLLRLREAGRRLVLISLADDPPAQVLEGIVSYHLPPPPRRRGPIAPTEETLRFRLCEAQADEKIREENR
ncbi:MAG: DUF58 domain-containing protein [Anaerolineae bacterium]|jgi:uncharacterized protein (DUF58 family)|nr:DUF58 domain-containing protein [Anaerolineae bacterium]MDH7473348.1 DUF58 domain-containing protein [Anaerolineae bacterium]